MHIHKLKTECNIFLTSKIGNSLRCEFRVNWKQRKQANETSAAEKDELRRIFSTESPSLEASQSDGRKIR